MNNWVSLCFDCVFYCVCSSSTHCSVLLPLGWRRLWLAGVASVSSLPCSCHFTYRSSRLPVWVRSRDRDGLNSMALHVIETSKTRHSHTGVPLNSLIGVFPFVSDQSAELQAQITNLFKSLAVQLQGAFAFFTYIYIYELLADLWMFGIYFTKAFE